VTHLVLYHKTGYVLSMEFVRRLAKAQLAIRGKDVNNDKIKGNRVKGSQLLCPHPNQIPSSGTVPKVIRVASPAFVCSGVARQFVHGLPRMVHHVRDPYSMIISSYLYHRQDPTPELGIYSVTRPCEMSDARCVCRRERRRRFQV
jgi:hypothetical protein